MDQLVILLIFGVIATVNYLLKKRGESDDAPRSDAPVKPAPPYRPARPQAEEDEEKLRRFMEALGVPPPPPTPPKIVRPVQTVQRRVRPAVERRPKPSALPSPALPAILPAETAIPVSAPSLVTAPSYKKKAATMPEPASNIHALLRNRDSIRQAILLKEILGAPRGLEPYR